MQLPPSQIMEMRGRRRHETWMHFPTLLDSLALGLQALPRLPRAQTPNSLPFRVGYLTHGKNLSSFDSHLSIFFSARFRVPYKNHANTPPRIPRGTIVCACVSGVWCRRGRRPDDRSSVCGPGGRNPCYCVKSVARITAGPNCTSLWCMTTA